jgi:hypothetical protein
MAIDYRFDKRDRQYKLLDINPRIGAQFHVFVDDNGVDVARALYRGLTGQNVRRARQVDGRVFVVEKLWGGRRRSWHLHRPYEPMEVALWPKSMISAEA